MVPNFIFLTGKGGVGKTSIASAIAYKLSTVGKKVLLVSIDPAHSLSDIFEMEIGPNEKQILENLYAIELEPKTSLSETLKSIVEPLKEFYKNMFGESFVVDNSLEEAIMEVTESPGADEVAAFEMFQKILVKEDSPYDYIVFDTAPTGHTLKFLKLPDILEKQINVNIKVRQKTSKITELVKKMFPFLEVTKEEELELMKFQEEEKRKLMKTLESIKKTKEILQDKNITKFIIVANPDGLTFYETKKLVESLKNLGIEIYQIIINKVLPDKISDPYLNEWKKIQRNWIEKFREEFSNYELQLVELLPYEIKGIDKIKELASKINI